MSKINAYKGFGKDLSCRGYQFEVGQTYRHDGGVKACSSGFHACTNPQDVFAYYDPANSRFCEVILSGETATHEDDSKVAAEIIEIGRELSLGEMIDAAVKATFSAAKKVKGSLSTGYSGAASATGYRGAASATGYSGAASATGYRGAASATGDSGAASATGHRGAASATGYRGAASATGDSGAASATGHRGAASATGKHGVAIAAGYACRALAADGCALFLVERNDDDSIAHVFAGIAGHDGVRPEVWYRLIGGVLTEDAE